MVRGTRVPAEPAGLPATGGTAPPGRPSHHRPELPRAERQPGHDPGPREDPVDPVADHARPAAATPAPTAPSPAAPGRAAPCRRHGPLPGRTAVPRAGAAVPVPLHDQGGAAGGRRLVAPDAGPRTGRPHTAGARSPASGPLPGTTGKPARKVRKRPPGRWAPGGAALPGPVRRTFVAQPAAPAACSRRAPGPPSHWTHSGDSGVRREWVPGVAGPRRSAGQPQGRLRSPARRPRALRGVPRWPARRKRAGHRGAPWGWPDARDGAAPGTPRPGGLVPGLGPAEAPYAATGPGGRGVRAARTCGGAGPVRPGRQSTLGRMCGSARSSS
ncbi:Uncharacterised protein [Streptomyces griseus]|uniref:Uncharacterized protein n=1 Tax=Streptomyces griseus TaxID=1911 RepID=A0A380NBE3_STRGR|nr:Uncharacterised protein [Streptomyces griseus]